VVWCLPCSDKDHPIEEKDEDEGFKECGTYHALKNSDKYYPIEERDEDEEYKECGAYHAVTLIL
jgi:hypothetical protein